MKKKIITLAMAAVMTFALNITAVAAPSATATVYNSDGTVSTVGVSSQTKGISASLASASAEEVKAEADLVAAAAAVNATVEKALLVELNADADWTPGEDIKLTVAGLGVKVGDTVVVRHKVNGAWQTETAEVVGDDVIVLKNVKSCSPFLIAKVAVNASASNNSTSTAAAAVASAANATSTATSPKTGFSVLKAVVDLF